MQKHTVVYLEAFNLDESDFVPCEVCSSRAVDIHHIISRGMGGSKLRNDIENLMALCRECHDKYGDKKDYLNFLKTKHFQKLSQFSVNFSEDYFVIHRYGTQEDNKV